MTDLIADAVRIMSRAATSGSPAELALIEGDLEDLLRAADVLSRYGLHPGRSHVADAAADTLRIVNECRLRHQRATAAMLSERTPDHGMMPVRDGAQAAKLLREGLWDLLVDCRGSTVIVDVDGRMSSCKLRDIAFRDGPDGTTVLTVGSLSWPMSEVAAVPDPNRQLRGLIFMLRGGAMIRVRPEADGANQNSPTR